MTTGRPVRRAFVIVVMIMALMVSGCDNDRSSDTKEVRFPGEFEPMQAVTIAWPLDLPVDLVEKMTENVDVYVIIDPNNTEDSTEYVEQFFASKELDTDRIHCYEHELVNPYLRDYGAFFVFRDGRPEVVNFDNSVTWDDIETDEEESDLSNEAGMNNDMTAGETFGIDFAEHLEVSSTMSTIHMDGGNLMSDGRGTAVSDVMVTRTNDNDTSNIREELRRVMGIENYILTTDPQGGYIEHVDCWGKFLAPDKILIARVPEEHPRYDEYEDMAALFRSTLCCWGYPYKVYRVDEPLDDEDPDKSDAYPYTNSLILNKCVYLPLGERGEYNKKAIEAYKKALPGYEIYGFKADESFLPWYNTDSLHCRTHEIPDFNMVFVDHYNVVHGEVDFAKEYSIEASVTAYSGKELKEGYPRICYRIDGLEWKEASMEYDEDSGVYKGNIPVEKSDMSDKDVRIDYYVIAEDEGGNKGVQPYTGADDPHSFIVRR